MMWTVRCYWDAVHFCSSISHTSPETAAGGGTDFPLLDLTVMPKKGSAVIWPSVKNEAPNEKDSRTDHQALPVEAGTKYGANACG